MRPGARSAGRHQHLKVSPPLHTPLFLPVLFDAAALYSFVLIAIAAVILIVTRHRRLCSLPPGPPLFLLFLLAAAIAVIIISTLIGRCRIESTVTSFDALWELLLSLLPLYCWLPNYRSPCHAIRLVTYLFAIALAQHLQFRQEFSWH